MADDRQQPWDATGEDSAEPGRPGDAPEHTQEFDPLTETDTEQAATDQPAAAGAAERESASDETMPLPGSPPAPAEVTAKLPPAAAMSGSDATTRLPRSPNDPVSQTARLPAAREAGEPPPPPGAWSGRAGVPPTRPPTVRGPAPAEWSDDDGQVNRRWWLPIVVGLIALVLLGMLAFGIWLIVQASQTGTGPPPISPSPSASPTPEPTSAAPTTAAPTPSETVAATVLVPPVIGLSQEEAQALLEQAGLTFQLQSGESNRPPGTVIATDPRPSTAVATGAQVTLVIASPPAPTTPATTPPTTPATTGVPAPPTT
jgi:hypothetical protein